MGRNTCNNNYRDRINVRLYIIFHVILVLFFAITPYILLKYIQHHPPSPRRIVLRKQKVVYNNVNRVIMMTNSSFVQSGA